MGTGTVVLKNGGFESGEGAPAAWRLVGTAVLDETEAFEGSRALRLERPADDLRPTSATSDSFAVTAGVWEVSGALKSDLYFQDLSFNATVDVEFQDAAGELVERRTVGVAHGVTAWRRFRKRVAVPDGAVAARIVVGLNKTFGVVWVDALTVRRVGDGGSEAGARHVARLATKHLGNLFYPGEEIAVRMNLEMERELAAEEMTVAYDVRDYWGVLCVAPARASLVRSESAAEGRCAYEVVMPVAPSSVITGMYYELHVAVPFLDGAAHESMSFAVLPEAPNNACDPMEVPFGSHTWNATMADYFPLSARLGLRRPLVFWRWPHEPPYTPEYRSGHEYRTRLGLPKENGMRPFGVVYPIMDIEQGKYEHTEESLRAGIRQSIELYKGDGLWGFQIGNEPPHWDPAMVARDVEAYRVVYDEIKKTDPDIFVIGSAIGPDETFFEAGFQPYCDAYNIHAYSDLNELRRAMRRYRELFETYGGAKPIYSTEIGSKSQGLTRHQIACDIVRKPVCFFADGGEFFTWFAVMDLDPVGKKRGSYSDSMNLYDGYLNMHNPRLDAIAYYHIANAISTKRFVREVVHDDGVSAFLFRDASGACLQVLWSAGASTDRLIPLDGVDGVRATHIDGRDVDLDARGEGVTLRVSSDPVMLTYQDARRDLPAVLPEATLSVVSIPDQVAQGGAGEIAVRAAADQAVTLCGPPLWTVGAPERREAGDGTSTWSFRFDVPSDCPAREATFAAVSRDADGRARGELSFRVPVASMIECDIVPRPCATLSEGAVELTVTNNGPDAQRVAWCVELVDEVPLNGVFRFEEATPATAYFGDVSEGELTVGGASSETVRLDVSEVDRLTIYTVRATARDASGKAVVRERLMGGFVGVPRASGPVTVDGTLDEDDWARPPVLAFDEARQFLKSEPMGHWRGPDDLSGALRFLWDETYLYVGVEVVDDVFVNNNADARIWDGDSLQLLIDPYRDRRETLGRYDYAFGVGTKGPQVWCTLSADARAPTGEVTDMAFAARRTGEGGNMTYEIGIPWSRLAPFEPAPGRNLGLAMLINEDDGEGRGGFLGWFSGVHLKKVGHVGDLILTGR